MRSIDEMEEITNDKTIVRKDKRGKIINNFEEMIKNNIELTFGPNIIINTIFIYLFLKNVFLFI